jgi:hypothetical protein
MACRLLVSNWFLTTRTKKLLNTQNNNLLLTTKGRIYCYLAENGNGVGRVARCELRVARYELRVPKSRKPLIFVTFRDARKTMKSQISGFSALWVVSLWLLWRFHVCRLVDDGKSGATIIALFNNSRIQKFNHSVIQSFSHSINLSFSHSLIHAFSHSIIHSHIFTFTPSR